MEFEENNQTQDASFPEKPNETPAQDMPGAEAEESSRQPDAQARREKQYETFTMLHDLVYILAAITLVFVFLFRLVGVKGSSMYPTLFDHDYLVLESNFLYRTVRQGDIVVIDPPQQAQLDGSIVKRVIATGGQTVDIDFESGTVYVLDSLPRALAGEPYTPYGAADEMHTQYGFVQDSAFNRNFTAARISPTVIRLSLTQNALEALRAEPEETALARRARLMKPLILFGPCVMMLSLPGETDQPGDRP